MKILKSSLLALTLSSVLVADNYEYSYFGVGNETFNYSEIGHKNSTNVNFKSEAKTSSPVYKSGTVLQFMDKFVLSMDLMTTLSQSETTENWI